MSKEIIIVALIILAIYLYYQQNNQPLPIQSDNQEIKDLQQQVSHYQTLYQKRVEKDIGGADQNKKISHLQKQIIKLKQTNQSLQKDLSLSQRLAELRKVPYYSSEDKGTALKYALYSLLTVVFSC